MVTQHPHHSSPPLIQGDAPRDWRALQNEVAQLLQECGLSASTDHAVELARGQVNIDVVALDTRATIPVTYVCECKHWSTPVPQEKVHAFRTVVGDSGANIGFLISSAGFQPGAVQAASYSNVRLVTWGEFQQLLALSWFRHHMAPKLVTEGDALHQYTEPINSAVSRAAGALDGSRKQRFHELRHTYAVPSFGLLIRWYGVDGSNALPLPSLPLGRHLNAELNGVIPASVTEATALRPLLDATIDFYRTTTALFDDVFGKRVPETHPERPTS